MSVQVDVVDVVVPVATPLACGVMTKAAKVRSHISNSKSVRATCLAVGPWRRHSRPQPLVGHDGLVAMLGFMLNMFSLTACILHPHHS